MKKQFILTVLGFVLILGGGLTARAAVCTVNALTDTGAGSGGANGAGDLRYCITQTNLISGAHTINVTVTGTVMMTAGMPTIARSLTINGSGQTDFIIDGTNVTGLPESQLRPFNIYSFTEILTVSINNLTVQNGKSGYSGGGGINIQGTNSSAPTLNLRNVTLDHNTAAYDGGGAINARNAHLNIVNSRITNNIANGTQSEGGGLAFVSTMPVSLFISGTLVKDNVTDGYNPYPKRGGGASFNATNSPIKIENSTFSGNFTTGSGGGLFYQGSGLVSMSNVTVSGNTAGTVDTGQQQSGGGIEMSSPTILRNCTIAGNSAASRGGGIYFGSIGNRTIANSIIANNTAPTSPDTTYSFQGIKLGTNIFTTAPTGVYNGSGTNLVADPLLNPLADNGGLVPTRSWQMTSPARDAGANSEALDTNNAPLVGDARSLDYWRIVNSTVDIGAYEHSTNQIVTNADNSGAGSLRQAISDALPNTAVIFSAYFFNQPRTITLTGGQISINKNLTLEGMGADTTIIDAGNASRIFNIASDANVSVNRIKLTRGDSGTNPGGCVSNNGIFNLNDSEISNCAASSGGGIFNNSNATLTIVRSTLSGNLARGDNGGAVSNAWLFFINNSTISGNSSNGKGGGLYNYAPSNVGIYMNNVTVTNNSSNFGGGVFNEFGTGSFISARNSIFAGNTFITRGPDFDGGLCSRGNNLIANTAWTGIGCNTAGNILGVSARLTPLGDYGGTTQTHALLSNSPALNAGTNCVLTTNGCGDNNSALTFDQRNSQRRIGTNVDIGAFEQNITFNESILPNGYQNGGYYQTLSVTRQTDFAEFSNNLAPFTFSIIAGALPPGLTLASEGSVYFSISGTPTQVGTFTFTIKATDADGMAGIQQYTMQILAPTAANVSVSGRIAASDGRGIRNVIVTLTDANGTSRTIRTSAFGFYNFYEVTVGETYIISVNSKRFTFNPSSRILNVSDEITDFNFIAEN